MKALKSFEKTNEEIKKGDLIAQQVDSAVHSTKGETSYLFEE